MAAPQLIARPHQPVRQLANINELWPDNDGTIEVVLPFGQHGIRVPLYSSANGGASRAMLRQRGGQFDRGSISHYSGQWIRYETDGPNRWAMVFRNEDEARNKFLRDPDSPAFISIETPPPPPARRRRRHGHRHANPQQRAGQQRRNPGPVSRMFSSFACWRA